MSAPFEPGHDPALPAFCAVALGNDRELFLLGLSQGLGGSSVGLYSGEEAQTVLLFGGGAHLLELFLQGH